MGTANRWPLLLALALGFPTAPASSQQLYRCGNTYSQTPCAADAAPQRIHADAAEQPAGLAGFALCAAAGPKATGSPEPESARIRPVGERRSEVIQYAGQAVAAHRYDLGVDAKSPYGVYAGERLFSCWVSEDQRRVLKFSPRRN